MDSEALPESGASAAEDIATDVAPAAGPSHSRAERDGAESDLEPSHGYSSSTGSLPPIETLVQRRPIEAIESEKKAALSTPRAVPRGVSSVIQETPKVLVLDLDETLIHSTLRATPVWYMLGRSYDRGKGRDPELPGSRSSSNFLNLLGLGMRGEGGNTHSKLQPTMIEVQINGRSVMYQVYKRPWADYFLKKVASWYQVVIFTASVQEYADPVIDWLDGGRGLISRRYFRESCKMQNGSYTKDLQVVEKDLSKVCLVDNSPISYVLDEANGVPIKGWTHDPNDDTLLDLLPVLDALRFASDVRHILGMRGF